MKPLRLEELRESAVLLAQRPPAFVRGTLYVFLLLLSILLSWAYLVRVPVMVVADGRVRPTGRLWRVDAEAGGRVVAAAVEENRLVEAGEVLLRLDPTLLQLELAGLEKELEVLRPERDELTTMAEGLARSGPERAEAVPGLQRHRDRYAAWMREIELAAVDLRRRRQEAQRLEQLQAVVSEAELTAARLTLAEAEATAALTLARRRAEVERGLDETTRRIQALDVLRDRKKDEIARMEVRSPVRGTVTAVEVRRVGEVVKPGQPLFQVSPEGAEYMAEVWVPAHRAGFVTAGMPARVEIPTFPQSAFGWLTGTVATVSPDASGESGPGGPLYRVEIALAQDRLSARDGRVGLLRLGLQTRARLVVREERLLFHVAGVLGDAFRWGP